LPLFRELLERKPSFDIRPTNQHAVILTRDGEPALETGVI
jgi:hypothetical protein